MNPQTIALFTANSALKDTEPIALGKGAVACLGRPVTSQQLADVIRQFTAPAPSVGAAWSIGTMSPFIAHATFDA